MKLNHIFKTVLTVALSACFIASLTVSSFAWNTTKSKSAYSYYYGYSMGTLEARVWVSTLVRNFTGSQVTFDSTTSSWVFNATKQITKHVNGMTTKKTGFTGSLSVGAAKSGASAGVTVSEQTDSVCTIQTKPANSYYRGITSYNNTITRGIVGTLLQVTALGILTTLVVTGASSQTVYLEGQIFTNSATVTSYF